MNPPQIDMRGVLDQPARIHVPQGRQRLTVTFFRETDVRLQCFLHEPATGAVQAIGEITRIIGGAGLNIVSFKNESNGKLGNNLIDLDVAVPDSLVEQLAKLDKVVKVRRLSLA